MNLERLYNWLIDNKNTIDQLWEDLANSYYYNNKLSLKYNKDKEQIILKIAKMANLDFPSARTESAIELIKTIHKNPLKTEYINNLIKTCTNERITESIDL